MNKRNGQRAYRDKIDKHKSRKAHLRLPLLPLMLRNTNLIKQAMQLRYAAIDLFRQVTSIHGVVL